MRRLFDTDCHTRCDWLTALTRAPDARPVPCILQRKYTWQASDAKQTGYRPRALAKIKCQSMSQIMKTVKYDYIT